MVIEFDSTTELMQGWLQYDDAPFAFFSGWLELASGLEKARERQDDRRAD